jgi:hypothetical protein
MLPALFSKLLIGLAPGVNIKIGYQTDGWKDRYMDTEMDE